MENITNSFFDFVRNNVAVSSQCLIFYTENNLKTVSFSDMADILNKGLACICFKCFTGENALDFQLSSELGYRISKYGNEVKYVIVSNDRGYDPLIHYWAKRGFSVERIAISKAKVESVANVKDNVVKNDAVVTFSKEISKSDCKKALIQHGFSKIIVSDIIQYISNHKDLTYGKLREWMVKKITDKSESDKIILTLKIILG